MVETIRKNDVKNQAHGSICRLNPCARDVLVVTTNEVADTSINLMIAPIYGTFTRTRSFASNAFGDIRAGFGGSNGAISAISASDVSLA